MRQEKEVAIVQDRGVTALFAAGEEKYRLHLCDVALFSPQRSEILKYGARK